MKILPILLVNNTIEELPVIIYDCEKIVIEHLTCITPVDSSIFSCMLHFNGALLKFQRVETVFRRTVFYIDGIKGKFQPFDIRSPCNLKFLLNCDNGQASALPGRQLRFLLHLSLEVKNTKSLQES